MLALMLLLNFAISWFNAWATGKTWAESREIGGWARVLAWSGAIMSACGFTWVYVIALAFIAHSAGVLSAHWLKTTVEVGYAVVILPVLGAGTVIWVDSLVKAWRERTLLTGGIAAWNTLAHLHNVYEAASVLPGVFKRIEEAFCDDQDSSETARLVLQAIIIFACGAGALTTAAILKSSARARAAEFEEDRLRAHGRLPL